MSENPQQTLIDLLGDERTCMLTTLAADGDLQSAPLTMLDVDDHGDVVMLVRGDSLSARNIAANPRVNLAIMQSSTWISVSGQARVNPDRQRVKELWNTMVDAWFPEGPESSDVVALEIDTQAGQYWTSPGGAPVMLVKAMAAKARGTEPSGGENEKVDLP